MVPSLYFLSDNLRDTLVTNANVMRASAKMGLYHLCVKCDILRESARHEVKYPAGRKHPFTENATSRKHMGSFVLQRGH